VKGGGPKLLSRRALGALGPSVTFTALARMSTPRSIFSRASPEKRTSFAAISSHSIALFDRPIFRLSVITGLGPAIHHLAKRMIAGVPPRHGNLRSHRVGFA